MLIHMMPKHQTSNLIRFPFCLFPNTHSSRHDASCVMRERLNRQLGPRLVPIIAATRTQPPLDVLPLPPLLRPAGPPRRMMVRRLRVQLLPPRQMPHRRRIANLRTRLARARSLFAVSSAPLMRLDIYRLAAPKTRCWYLPTIPWAKTAQHSTTNANEIARRVCSQLGNR
jgi:hypothetical protein